MRPSYDAVLDKLEKARDECDRYAKERDALRDALRALVTATHISYFGIREREQALDVLETLS